MLISIDAENASPETQQAALELVYVALAHAESQARRWFARLGQEKPEWANLAAILNKRLLVSAAELAEVAEKVQAILEPYNARTRTDAPAGARVAAVQVRIVPTDEPD
jgi:hypothetical protein